MKITIEAETDAERKALAEPWVRTGCLRCGLSGIADRTDENRTGEFGFLHGDGLGIRGDLARLIGNLDAQTIQQTTINGLLQANKMIHDAQVAQGLAEEIRNGKPLRLHRP